jgi:microsomal epoxide hydrolase
MTATASPFRLHIPDAALEDLQTRLALTRLPDEAPEAPWKYGTSVAYLRDLLAYWRQGFDWRAEEAALNAFPQFRTKLNGIDLHFLHVPGEGPSPMPLLLSHGWPGSVFEFLDLIPRDRKSVV